MVRIRRAARREPSWRGERRSAAQPAVGRAIPGRAGAHRAALVERVEVGPAGADIRLRVEGLAGLVRDLAAIAPEALRAAA